jgi:hypothetical protein
LDSWVDQRAGDLASLQHKIDAYRQMQHDTLQEIDARLKQGRVLEVSPR